MLYFWGESGGELLFGHGLHKGTEPLLEGIEDVRKALGGVVGGIDQEGPQEEVVPNRHGSEVRWVGSGESGSCPPPQLGALSLDQENRAEKGNNIAGGRSVNIK